MNRNQIVCGSRVIIGVFCGSDDERDGERPQGKNRYDSAPQNQDVDHSEITDPSLTL